MEDQRKLSVLFVDDEPALLELLPRLLADMSEHWHMEFVGSAEQGLELMAHVAFDVVVSDLNMPGMRGNEFLTEVRERYPLSARIIYSSYSDQRSILECVGVIHQFLPKPCPTELLKATIQRAAMIRSLLPNPAIREKISKMERIPSMPTLYLELIRKLQSQDSSIDDIAKTVAQDIGMTAQILKIVNSAFFGLPHPTSNIAEAISFIGVETVKHLVLAAGIFRQFESRKLGGLSLETLWQHSSRAAGAAKAIAKSERAGRQVIEDAMAAGLLHDVGKLVLASNYPDQYEEIGRQAQAKQVEWLVEEREVFGFEHADVGGYLLGLWGLPPPVVEAVAFHHFPTKSERASFTALTAVHAANVLVQTQRPTHGGIVPPQIDLLYLAKIGRTDALDRWRDELNEAPAI
ncbi:MAG: HDOD domain-containing protein [Verrucomicrobia bacterium]|nr:HDOD domain-containing protein [Verrucomicrobiota bacterium]